MKHEKKLIWKTVLASLPVMAFLACGNVKEAEELVDLLNEQQETAENQKMDINQEAVFNTLQDIEKTAFVHICGEVESPGVYEVSEDSRVCDVLLLAGGFTEDAAQSAINLAEHVIDGMMVVVPSKEEMRESSLQLKVKDAGLVDINTASMEELCTLPGIGKSRAEAIITYRQEYGCFTSKEDIMLVSGIKSGMYEDLKDKIYVSE